MNGGGLICGLRNGGMRFAFPPSYLGKAWSVGLHWLAKPSRQPVSARVFEAVA